MVRFPWGIKQAECRGRGEPAVRGPRWPGALFAAGCVLAAAIPAGALDNSDHWVTRPESGVITVIGVAGRQRKLDDAIADALADAARKVSLYYGVYGEVSVVLKSGSNYLDYYADTDYSLVIRQDADAYLGSLVYNKETDVFEKNGAVYVRARYSGVSSVPEYKSELQNGAPSWVREYQAEIPGFMAGIGASKNKGSLQRTLRASYENAIVSLLPRLATKMEGSVIDNQSRGGEGGKLTQNVSVSYGVLSNVMILETWFDKRTGIVWTLLAAKPVAINE